MELPRERVGPYVRALRAALDALAPNEDHVSLSAALDHLHALDPANGGSLLLPAEVSTHTGMPTYQWLERARSEAVLATRGTDAEDPSDAELQRARDLDPELGARMHDRRTLHRHLRTAELLPATRIGGAIRRIGDSGWMQVALAYDRMVPDGRWVRVRVELKTPGPPTGAIRLDPQGRLIIEESLQHLLTRHFATPLMALRAQLTDAVGAEVLHLGRGWIGPFWFPGVQLPAEVPEQLGSGLLMQGSTEVIANDVRASRHLDPLEPPPEEALPEGYGSFRERRFAASDEGLAEAVRSWASDDRGMRAQVVTMVLTRARRL
ncbi:MAG: hypothetical protein KTR31_21925 [Myxococcales bacterium]|nr:hypothetical protein [Myxococcales bacterium]